MQSPITLGESSLYTMQDFLFNSMSVTVLLLYTRSDVSFSLQTHGCPWQAGRWLKRLTQPTEIPLAIRELLPTTNEGLFLSCLLCVS